MGETGPRAGLATLAARTCWQRVGLGLCATLPLVLAVPAQAQSGSLDALRVELEALRAEQRAANARIARLEAELRAQRTAADTPASPPAATAQAPSTPAVAVAHTSPAGAVNASGGSSPGVPPAAQPGRLRLSGDLRLRFESNFSGSGARDRDRAVLRARLRASYALTDWLSLGGELATGDPDDPNSTDVTLSNFDDDLQVSLDQAYARIARGGLTLVGGKVPQPFVRTELVWDGDVNPQGVSASYRVPLAGGAALKATGLYFIVDESAAGPDSDMIGVQLGLESAAAAPVRFELAAAYYGYALRNVAGADNGDVRSNLLRPDGGFLSDFKLIDGVGAVSYHGLGPRWPVRLVGNYVKNLGAASGRDTGFGVDLVAGRGTRRGDLRFGYGYAQTDVDAVLAAFSHDNTDIPTNYLQHSLVLEFLPRDNLILNATLYHYRTKDLSVAPASASREWLNRLRLNLLMNF
jgi:hypothetical protein